MTHIGGPAGKYTPRVRELLENSPNVFICGHSHILKVMQVKSRSLLHLNPGAAGIQDFIKCAPCSALKWRRENFKTWKSSNWETRKSPSANGPRNELMPHL